MRRLNIGSFVLLVFALIGPIYSQQLVLDPPVTYSETDRSEVMAVSYSVVYKAWRQGVTWPRVLFTRSLDSGQTWEEPRYLTSTSDQYYPGSLSIAAAEENVYVAWRVCTGPSVYCEGWVLAASNDWGETFGALGRGGPNDDSAGGLLLSAFGSNVFLAWSECIIQPLRVCVPYREDVLLFFSSEAGRNGRTITIAGNQPYNSPVKLLSYGMDVYVFWRSDGGRIFMRHGTLQ